MHPFPTPTPPHREMERGSRNRYGTVPNVCALVGSEETQLRTLIGALKPYESYPETAEELKGLRLRLGVIKADRDG